MFINYLFDCQQFEFCIGTMISWSTMTFQEIRKSPTVTTASIGIRSSIEAATKWNEYSVVHLFVSCLTAQKTKSDHFSSPLFYSCFPTMNTLTMTKSNEKRQEILISQVTSLWLVWLLVTLTNARPPPKFLNESKCTMKKKKRWKMCENNSHPFHYYFNFSWVPLILARILTEHGAADDDDGVYLP